MLLPILRWTPSFWNGLNVKKRRGRWGIKYIILAIKMKKKKKNVWDTKSQFFEPQCCRNPVSSCPHRCRPLFHQLHCTNESLISRLATGIHREGVNNLCKQSTLDPRNTNVECPFAAGGLRAVAPPLPSTSAARWRCQASLQLRADLPMIG